MTITPANNDVNALVADVTSGDVSVDFMFGIGLVKDSEAVFFQYVGESATPQALVQANGKPVTRIGNVYLTGLSIVENFGEFNQTKLNVYLKTQQGASVMLTSGLTTIWSQCLLTSLQGLVNDNAVDSLISVDSWKGTAKMRPCFAAIRNGQNKVTAMTLTPCSLKLAPTVTHKPKRLSPATLLPTFRLTSMVKFKTSLSLNLQRNSDDQYRLPQRVLLRY